MVVLGLWACADSRSPRDQAGAITDADPPRSPEPATGAAGREPAAGTAGSAVDGAPAPPDIVHEADARPPADPPDAGLRDAAPDAMPEPRCELAGEPRIEPSGIEISGAQPQQFTLEGVTGLVPGCVRWQVSPSGFRVFGTNDIVSPTIDPETGVLTSLGGIPDDVDLLILVEVGGEVIAQATVRYFDPKRVLEGVFHEVGVLRCPDYVEVPRENTIQEIFLEDFQVTFQAFETYVDYRGTSSHQRTQNEARTGTFEFTVDWSNFEPDTLVKSGTYHARRSDGRLELRDLWLGPDAAQCGHVLERWK